MTSLSRFRTVCVACREAPAELRWTRGTPHLPVPLCTTCRQAATALEYEFSHALRVDQDRQVNAFMAGLLARVRVERGIDVAAVAPDRETA